MKGAAGPPHLLHVFSTFVPAGPEMRTVRMINALGDEYRHSILAVDGRTSAAAELAPSANARVLPNLPRAGTPQTVRNLRRLIVAETPALVLSYNWGAFDSVLASRSLLRGACHIHHEDGFNADEAQSFKKRREWLRRLALPGVARVVVPSSSLLSVARTRWRLADKQVVLIPNGIELESFAARDGNSILRAELGIPHAAPVIGFVGHLRPVKNPRRLVRAFAKVRYETLPHLVILGEGEERANIEAEASRLHVRERVHLVGHRSDTAPWYRLMDLFAVSSDSEQMPVALLEAMASSLPVVSTDVGDVSLMLASSQTLFVVPLARADDGELAALMQRMIDNKNERESCGAANRARVEERYSFERMLASYRELYDEVLTARSRG